ncbi:MAG: glycosyltransferase, partial [bacterium]|nr:glycosyltransferase [bacterium]
MKIGIDAQVISRNQAGVTYYTRGLVEEIMRRDRKNRYDLMTLPPLAYRFYYKLHKWGIRIPLEVFFGSHDLYFFPNYVVYPHRRGRAVVVVHDLTFERVPRWVQPANVEFLRRFVPPSVEKADHVVAVSEFTKKDLIKIYGLPGKKITVVPPAVDPQLFKPQPESRI